MLQRQGLRKNVVGQLGICVWSELLGVREACACANPSTLAVRGGNIHVRIGAHAISYNSVPEGWEGQLPFTCALLQECAGARGTTRVLQREGPSGKLIRSIRRQDVHPYIDSH
jgi:hypothetical protein